MWSGCHNFTKLSEIPQMALLNSKKNNVRISDSWIKWFRNSDCQLLKILFPIVKWIGILTSMNQSIMKRWDVQTEMNLFSLCHLSACMIYYNWLLHWRQKSCLIFSQMWSIDTIGLLSIDSLLELLYLDFDSSNESVLSNPIVIHRLHLRKN